MIPEQKIQEHREYLTQVGSWVHDIIEQVEKDFAKTPEGIKSEHRETLLKKYFGSTSEFLIFAHQSHQLETWARDPNQGNDPELAKTLAKFAKELNREKLPDHRHIQLIDSSLKLAKDLKPAAPLNGSGHKLFHDNFKESIHLVSDFKDLLQKILADDTIAEFNFHNAAVNIWKYILFRLVKGMDPGNDPKLHQVIQATKALIPDFNAFKNDLEIMKQHENIDVTLLDRMFAPESTKDPVERIQIFGDALEKDKNNQMKQLLIERCKDKRYASVQAEFKKGKRSVDAFTTIALIAKKKMQEITEIETRAKAALEKQIDDFKAEFEKEAKDEADRFKAVLTEEIAKLRKEHDEKLKLAHELRSRIDSSMKALTGSGSILVKLDEKEHEAIIRKNHFWNVEGNLLEALDKFYTTESLAFDNLKMGKMSKEQFLAYWKQLTKYKKVHLDPEMKRMMERSIAESQDTSRLKQSREKFKKEAGLWIKRLESDTKEITKMDKELHDKLGATVQKVIPPSHPGPKNYNMN